MCLLVSALLFASACVDELPEDRVPCPCAAGWYCDQSEGLCRKGACTPIASVLDRFDDDHIDDWTVEAGDVSLVDSQLRLLRDTTSMALASRDIDLGPGPFSVQVRLSLSSPQSWAALGLGKAGAKTTYNVVLANETQNGKIAGLFFMKDSYSAITDAVTPLVASRFTPVAGALHSITLHRDAAGTFELFLDGELLGQATDRELETFDRLDLRGGQATSAGHGGSFDQVTVQSCEAGVPTFQPSDVANPVWKGRTNPSHMLRDSTGYLLFHSDGNIHLDRSADGLSWKNAGTDIITDSLFQTRFNWDLSVLEEGGVYKAWISGTDNDCIAYTDIHLATSPDGLAWTPDATVLSHGVLGSYDSRNIYTPNVVKVAGTYHMYYSALATNLDAANQMPCPGGKSNGRPGIGYASSPDGRTWTRHGIVIPIGLEWEGDAAEDDRPKVIHNGTGFEMYYTGLTKDGGRVMYATSRDGKAWIKRGAVTSLDTGRVVAVFREGQSHRVFYMCGEDVCVAGSP